MIEVGAKAPDFTLPDHAGQEVSLSDFAGRRVLLAFYPLDFSPVCSDQLALYKDIQSDLDEAGVTMLGVSVDSAFAHKAFRDQLGIETSLLADFEPKGAVAEAYGAYLGQAGHSNRSLVLIGPDGVVEWVHETETPLDIPGPDLIVEAIRA
ncbi:MAG: redoxin domain-containing protein [Solirubrobacterales bacterium]|nr:redoxin domain-containing protein [Solirubrobacterales bacterium]